MLCFVLINSVLSNLLRVWVFARTGYATEGAHLISAQLSTDAVSALQKGLGTNKTVEATQTRRIQVNIRCVHPR